MKTLILKNKHTGEARKIIPMKAPVGVIDVTSEKAVFDKEQSFSFHFGVSAKNASDAFIAFGKAGFSVNDIDAKLKGNS